MGSSLLFVLFQSDCIAPDVEYGVPQIDGWVTQCSSGASYFFNHPVHAILKSDNFGETLSHGSWQLVKIPLAQ